MQPCLFPSCTDILTKGGKICRNPNKIADAFVRNARAFRPFFGDNSEMLRPGEKHLCLIRGLRYNTLMQMQLPV